MKKEYYIFDIVKFILSLLVVQIHIGLFSTYNNTMEEIFKNLIGRYAVPLFFIISSYLLFDKINKKQLFSNNNISIYKKYLKRLLILYISWTIIYYICFRIIFKVDINFSYYIFSILVNGFYRQFWFLNSIILGTSTLLLLLRIFTIKKILLISSIFYIIGLILVPYNSIFINLFSFIPKYNGDVVLCRNFLTFGLIYISIGYYLNCIKDKKINLKCIYFLLIIFSILSILEFIYLKQINCQYYATQIFIVLSSICIFTILSKVNLGYKKIYLKLRNYSTIIYCSHTLVYLLIKKFLNNINIFNNSAIMYILTIIICIVITEIIVYIDKNKLKINFLY